MIKNIVFDIGNVLAVFQPKEFLSRLFEDPNVQKELFMVLFSSGLWNDYDQGLYTTQELEDIACRSREDLRSPVHMVLKEWTRHVLPIKENLELVKELKENGYRTYILSNIPKDCYLWLKNNTELMKDMDGGIYSYQHKRIKPDPKIYQKLLDTYDLIGEKCLFIDDKKENLETAQALGFSTLWCQDPSTLSKTLKEKLNEV